MKPIEHHIKLFNAITNPLHRSSDELWAPLRRDSNEYWPEPEQEKWDDERMWREKH